MDSAAEVSVILVKIQPNCAPCRLLIKLFDCRRISFLAHTSLVFKSKEGPLHEVLDFHADLFVDVRIGNRPRPFSSPSGDADVWSRRLASPGVGQEFAGPAILRSGIAPDLRLQSRRSS